MNFDSDRMRYTAENCSIKSTLAIVGDKWSLLLLREAFFGIRRFEDFHRILGCARNLLSERLTKLTANGLLERIAYQEPGQRRRDEYHLTEKGHDLQPVLIALMQWGDRWIADQTGGPSVEVRHRICEGTVHAVLTCDHGHTTLTPRAIQSTPGPGARPFRIKRSTK